ncbi:hypothetical protein Tco_0452715 [Tanacetum coccineum]
MSVRLDDRSFQYPVGITKNMPFEVGKFHFSLPADLLTLKWKKTPKFPSSWDDPSFTLLMHIDVIDEILEEYFDVLLDEGSKILHSIEGTLLEEEIFSEFDKFMAMVADENSESKSNTKEPPFKKITINIHYKIKTSIKEPPTDLNLNPFLIIWNMYSWKNHLFSL